MRCYSCRKYDNCELPWKCSSTMYDCSAYELEQTNEEWLKQANTEQLAEWIASVVQKAISIKENNGIVMLESVVWWVEWLKQPHNGG